MNFFAAVKSCFSKYATFQGRARRSEYWWFALANSIINGIFFAIPVLNIIVSLALILPTLAVTVRRLHDTGRSGWWWLISLIPVIGSIVLIIFAVQDSQPGDNQYGPNPKA